MVGNDMSATDLEYLKFLQDNRGEQDVTNGSFFRSMVNVEVGGIQHNETKEEIHALKDINEQQKKQILELKEKLNEVEEENDQLEKEHLAMLKQKGHDVANAAGEGNVRKNSQNFVDNEEVASITEVKDKQIDVLSNMLAEKQQLYKASKSDFETKITELESSKTKEVQQKQIEI